MRHKSLYASLPLHPQSSRTFVYAPVAGLRQPRLKKISDALPQML